MRPAVFTVPVSRLRTWLKQVFRVVHIPGGVAVYLHQLIGAEGAGVIGIQLDFNKAVQAGTGVIVLESQSTGMHYTAEVSDPTQVTLAGSSAVVHLALPPSAAGDSSWEPTAVATSSAMSCESCSGVACGIARDASNAG